MDRPSLAIAIALALALAVAGCPGSAPSPASGASGAASAPTDATARGAIEVLSRSILAADMAGASRSFVEPAATKLARFAAAVNAMREASARLADAADEKLGPGTSKALRLLPEPLPHPDRVEIISVDESLDRATVRTRDIVKEEPRGATTYRLVKVAGAWKVTPSPDDPNLGEAALAEAERMQSAMMGAAAEVQRLTEDLRAGKVAGRTALATRFKEAQLLLLKAAAPSEGKKATAVPEGR